MSKKTDADYLRDMLGYAEDAVGMIDGKKPEDLEENRTLQYALQHCYMIMGEIAGRLTEQTRDRMPSVPWHQIVGTRNWVVHRYDGVDNAILWKTTHEDLPKLIQDILDVLPPEQT